MSYPWSEPGERGHEVGRSSFSGFPRGGLGMPEPDLPSPRTAKGQEAIDVLKAMRLSHELTSPNKTNLTAPETAPTDASDSDASEALPPPRDAE